MRDQDTVYWVGEFDGRGSLPCGGSTVGIVLLKGNELLTCDNVSWMETRTTQEDLYWMWEEWIGSMEDGPDGFILRTISDEEADRLSASAYELDLSEEEAHEAGLEAYEAGLLLEDNPIDENDDNEGWEAWEAGWCEGFKRDTGREYDEQDEEERQRQQERADLRASKETIARWWHEEHAHH